MGSKLLLQTVILWGMVFPQSASRNPPPATLPESVHIYAAKIQTQAAA